MTSTRHAFEQSGQAADARLIIDTIPTLAWVSRPDGSAEFFNQRWLEYTGLSAEQALDWGWKIAIHPHDLPRMLEIFQEALNVGQPFEAEGRLRRCDGDFRWFLFRGNPLLDGSGKVQKWYGTNTDLEDRKRAEDGLRAAMSERTCLDALRAEISMALARKDTLKGILHTCAEAMVRHLDVAFARIWTLSSDGLQLELQASAGMYTRLDGRYKRIPVGQLKIGLIAQERKAHLTNDVEKDPRVSDKDWARAEGMISFAGYPLVVENRIVGVMGMFSRKILTKSTMDTLAFIADGIAQGIDRKHAEDALDKSEERWRAVFENSAIGVALKDLNGRFLATNSAYQKMLGYTEEEIGRLTFLELTHEDYRKSNWKLVTELLEGKRRQFQIEKQYRRKDGSLIWVSNNVSLVPGTKSMPRFIMALSEDITERKQTEEMLLRSKADLLEAQQLTHTGNWKHGVSSGTYTISPETYRIFGINPEVEPWTAELWSGRIHPEDRRRVRELFQKSEVEKIDYQADYRIVLPSGSIRHIHSVGHPIVNESGDLVEFAGTAMDVTEQVQARTKLEQAFAEIQLLKDQLYKENLALRDEVDRISMFEEIVGTSQALQAVLSRVAKVAPTDSSVLITGETGTGKELIARAIHKRSQRSHRAFVSVNCAALAPSLISSELFGHEKGAFTGAMQRRLGRFELADGGTIFLDEVGELPLDIQVALLRVLQERQFERVGGTQSIRVDIRVIAATNCNLEGAVATGTFRSDLFYRLNVFPIKVPPLRERKDDLLMLLEYYVHRFATKVGKEFEKIDKRTLELFRSYDWPGNIRELQNVVERSVIVSPDDVFCVDEAWLSTDSRPAPSRQPVSDYTDEDSSRERQIIEAALAESRGRVSGPNGAAAKLQIPPSTLESRIKKLKIRKSPFKLS